MRTWVMEQGHVAFQTSQQNSKSRTMQKWWVSGLFRTTTDFTMQKIIPFYPKVRDIRIGVEVQFCSISPGSASRMPAGLTSSSITALISLNRSQIHFPIVFRLDMLSDWKWLIERQDRLSQLLVLFPLYLQILIYGDVPQTILWSCSKDRNWLDDPFCIPS